MFHLLHVNVYKLAQYHRGNGGGPLKMVAPSCLTPPKEAFKRGYTVANKYQQFFGVYGG